LNRAHRIAVFLCALLSSAVAAASDDRASTLSGAELRQMLSGNTITGRHDNGMPFSEYHAPDGRVLGHNNREVVDQGCWDIRGDEGCYYYAGGTVQGEFCWTFRKVGENGLRLELPRTGTMGVGLWQSGNPYGHSDRGKPWQCTPLISRLDRRDPGHKPNGPFTPRLAAR
jgi:hypothetical protein